MSIEYIKGEENIVVDFLSRPVQSVQIGALDFKAFQSCQNAKILWHRNPSFDPIEMPNSDFQTVHLDIMRSLPPSKLPEKSFLKIYIYLITFIDRANRKMKVAPVDEIRTTSIFYVFLTR